MNKQFAYFLKALAKYLAFTSPFYVITYYQLFNELVRIFLTYSWLGISCVCMPYIMYQMIHLNDKKDK